VIAGRTPAAGVKYREDRGNGMEAASRFNGMKPALVNGDKEAQITAESIWEAIPDPIFVIDFVDEEIGQSFRYVNFAACMLLGWSREELMAMRPGTVDEISGAIRDAAYDELVRYGRTTFETLMIASNGARIPMEIHASDAYLGKHRVCIAVARSLVARKELERQMREAKEAAEASNRAKSEFLALMSHEIRTPLHGVIGFASLLDGSDLSDRMRDAVGGIRDSADLLLGLVSDVLDFSRIEAGELALLPQPNDLAAQLHRTAKLFQIRAEEKGLTFAYHPAENLPALMELDMLRLEQIVGNLMGNALKFTEKGSISLSVSAIPKGAGSYEIQLSVADTGIGIAASELSRVFNRFSQVDSSQSRRLRGSGLGLVVVKRLCELMGGSATVHSEVGKGSVFTATFRATEVVKEDAGDTASTASNIAGEISGLRILVADDNHINRKLMARMLERVGCQAAFAIDGKEAITKGCGDCFELIFMDVDMPGVDGLEAVRRIREFEQGAGRKPARIVALTAGVSTQERAACSNAGMDDFLGKPFNEQGLRRLLLRPAA
jgi:PAS domain S-box-containing protein